MKVMTREQVEISDRLKLVLSLYRVSGVYCWMRKSDRKIYIGSSMNIGKRYRAHASESGDKTALKKALLREGEMAFEFFVLERCK